jgi:hypothetical protein
MKKTQEETKTGCTLAGDGRFDSPGWCAKLCTYVLEVLKSYLFNIYFHFQYFFAIGFEDEKDYWLYGGLQTSSKKKYSGIIINCILQGEKQQRNGSICPEVSTHFSKKCQG